MCGFVGVCNLHNDITNDKNIIENMNLKINNINEEYYFKDEHIHLGYSNNFEKDEESILKFKSIKHRDVLYTIVFYGRIYNKDELKKQLVEKEFELQRKFRFRNSFKSFYLFWN